jgi:hypothetical protein
VRGAGVSVAAGNAFRDFLRESGDFDKIPDGKTEDDVLKTRPLRRGERLDALRGTRRTPHVTVATKACTHGQIVSEDGFVGVAFKITQIGRYQDPTLAARAGRSQIGEGVRDAARRRP